MAPSTTANAPSRATAADVDNNASSNLAAPDPSSTTSPAADDDDPLAGVPELDSFLATTPEDRTAALKLVADSVAQQRQLANTALIFSPLNLGVAVGVLAVVGRAMRVAGFDWALIATTAAGVLMSLLLVCRFLTQDYLSAAEEINFDWLEGKSGGAAAGGATNGNSNDELEVRVTRFGEEIIAAIVVLWVGSGGSGKRRKVSRGVVRAWTVRLRYRGKGVGSTLLEDVVKEARKKGADTVEFDPEHATAKRILPSVYNGVFDKQERKARAMLQELLDSSSGKGKRR